jgi:SAM-dependent methyltransferase
MNKQYWRDRYERMGGMRTVGHSQVTPAGYQWQVGEITSLLAPILKPCIDVLDFGCGIGRWHKLLSGAAKRYHGCDIVPVFEPDTGEFQVIEPGAEPFPGKTFDLVWSCCVIQHIIDHDEARETVYMLHQKVKPGGQMILIENTLAMRPKEHIVFRSPSTYKRWMGPFGEQVKEIGIVTFGINEPHVILELSK